MINMKFWKFWQWPSKIEMMQAHIKALEEQTLRQRKVIDDVKKALRKKWVEDAHLAAEAGATLARCEQLGGMLSRQNRWGRK